MLALVTRWLKDLRRARRHRREARALAGLDRRMLADIGLTRSDVRDAFSSRFWEDPTDLLRERSGRQRGGASYATLVPSPDNGFRRPATDRPARQTI